MKKLLERIKNLIDTGESIAIVGVGGSGKTWFVKNELMPELERIGKAVAYFKDPEGKVEIPGATEIVTIDEFETDQVQ